MRSAAASVIDLAQIVGPACVRDPAPADLVDGIRPSVVVEPATAEAVGEVLSWCARERRSVLARGGGTKLSWGRPPERVDVLLSTRALNRLTRYEPGDLTVAVEAGMRIADLNSELARHRQWLPLDARGEAATIGGVVATNESGPLRHRYGAPRDVLIGIRIATADGRIASAGGSVVKNVAGYDLGRLVAGSFGSLAVIVGAAFKLSPVPAAATTLLLTFGTRESIAAAAAELAASQLDPVALDVETRVRAGHATHRLIVRMAGMAVPVDAQIASAVRLADAWAPVDARQLSGDDDDRWWREHAEQVWRDDGTVVKLSWMPNDLAAVLALLEELAGQRFDDVHLTGRAALGVGLLRLAGEGASIPSAIAMLRERRAVVGNVVLVHASAEVRRAVDVWGLSDGTAAVSRLLKQSLDPAGVLNAGRGPI
ncbi:MAG: FAD-binding oxidoreductase [Acidobacteria bacterium]|nr:FAD-binding oxidoreductase [Acidobacteriota bacterium]